VTPEQFRQYGHQLIDLIADYRQTVGERPVMAQVEPGYLKAALPATAPQQANPSRPSSTTSTNW
jgi:aromatic-L-amino-acid decarboxylase